MNLRQWTRGAVVLLAAAILVVGCAKKEEATPPKDSKGQAKGIPTTAGPHAAGTWCAEHGVPEDECSMCNDKVHAECKKKGELCDKHPDRAKSQCFICDWSLWEKARKRYPEFRKEGDPKEAPLPEKNMPEDKKPKN